MRNRLVRSAAACGRIRRIEYGRAWCVSRSARVRIRISPDGEDRWPCYADTAVADDADDAWCAHRRRGERPRRRWALSRRPRDDRDRRTPRGAAAGDRALPPDLRLAAHL